MRTYSGWFITFIRAGRRQLSGSSPLLRSPGHVDGADPMKRITRGHVWRTRRRRRPSDVGPIEAVDVTVARSEAGRSVSVLARGQAVRPKSDTRFRTAFPSATGSREPRSRTNSSTTNARRSPDQAAAQGTKMIQ